MKTILTFLLIVFFFLNSNVLVSQALIIDHNCAKLEPIPESAILQAKSDLHIAYGHTSHGSQLITGMTGLIGKTGLLGYKGDIYEWNEGGTGDALDIDDYFVSGDLGHTGDLTWEAGTRTYLANPDNSDVNVIIWSWCGGASDNTEAGMNIYLNAMNQLEIDFPNIKFVYMTGHLDGTGESGNLHIRNEQIRNYCLQNNKILYDFADIESYDPDENYYLDKLATDNCDYDSDDNGTRDANWATAWQGAHTEGVDWYSCTAAHSQALNGNLKAYAAWWLWAKLAGWDDGSDVSLNITSDEPMDECNLDSRSLNITLTGDTFADSDLSASNFQLNGAPSTTTVESITYIDSENATLALVFDGTDFDSEFTHFSITIDAAELTGSNVLISNELIISSNDEELEIEAEVSLIETNLDKGVINLSLTDESFSDDQLAIGNFQLNNVPTGTTVDSVVYTDATHAVLNLAYDGTDFDSDSTHFSITISINELTGCHDLTSNELIIESVDESNPYLTITVDEQLTELNLNEGLVHLTLTNETFIDGTFDLLNFDILNEPEGCTIEGITYLTSSTADLNLAFDGTDFDNDINDFSVIVDAAELNGVSNLQSDYLSIIANVENTASALISSTGSLTESQLDDAIIKLKIFEAVFNSTTPNVNNFILGNVPPGLEIGSIDYIENDSVVLNLSFDQQDFDVDYTQVTVTINSAEISIDNDLISNAVIVYSELEPNASASINEDLVESTLDGATVIIELDDESFTSDCNTIEQFNLQNVPAGVTIANVECRSETNLIITLAFDGTDFDLDSTHFCVLIDQSAVDGDIDLITNTLTIYAETESNISDINKSNQVNIFPNPGNGIINVEYWLTTSDKINIQIIDLAGKILMQKVYKYSSTKFKTSLDINHFDKGQYYLILRQGDTKIVKSVVFQ